LALGTDGAIYGVTESGGLGAGIAYQLTPPAAKDGTWTETVLHEFGAQSGDASAPNGLVLGPDRVLYGTAAENAKDCSTGSTNCGTVFQLTPPGSPGGVWTETILHTFTGPATADGSQPNSTPVLGPGGVLYGTTGGGGTGANAGGTVYEMIPPSAPGGNWTEVILCTFHGGSGGQNPLAVALGPDGNLYGTTSLIVAKGGPITLGTVFQVVLQ